MLVFDKNGQLSFILALCSNHMVVDKCKFQKLILVDKLEPLGIIDILLQPSNEVKISKIMSNYTVTTLLSNYAKSSDGQQLIVKL